MLFQRTRIATRLLAGFALVLFTTAFLGVIAVVAVQNLATTTERILRHPFTVTAAALGIKVELLQAHRELVDFVHTTDPAEAEILAQQVRAHAPRTDAHLAVIRERYLGKPEDVQVVEQALATWRASRDSVIALVDAGRKAEALALLQGSTKARIGALLSEVNDIQQFASNRAERFQAEATEQSARTRRTILFTLASLLVVGIGTALWITRSVGLSLRLALGHLRQLVGAVSDKQGLVEAIGGGDFERDLEITEPLRLQTEDLPQDDLGALLRGMMDLSRVQNALDQAFRRMASSLRTAKEAEQERNWLKNGLGELNVLLRGEQDAKALAEKLIQFFSDYLKAGVGALYLFDPEARELVLMATYAHTRRKHLGDRFALGEGLLGQAAQEGKLICLSKVPGDYLPIGSALGGGVPCSVVALPFLQDGALIGALELGAFRDFSPVELEFLQQAMGILAVGLGMNLSRQRILELLQQSQAQEEELRAQQEELQQSNEELEERAQLLEQQREEIRRKGLAMEAANREIASQAAEVERVSTYKSQFLANMSHELRTPLNSLMILSRLLADNRDGNLTEKQVEFAATIHGAGRDLLTLINDILDISKIESGRMEYVYHETAVADLAEQAAAIFRPLAQEKGLAFTVAVEPGAVRTLRTDGQRTQQILKNLLANALKFTEKGSVALEIGPAEPAKNPLAVPALALAVRDTGIGIAPGKFNQVFQAFQQADNDTSRRFGGTGLGLSISRQLARGLGGELILESIEGLGSTLTLYLPLANPGAAPALLASPLNTPAKALAASDDRDRLQPGQRCILIVEDDPTFASILVSLVRERGFAALHAPDGPGGVAMAEQYLPSAILLDVILPGLDGWAVMQRLTDKPRTRHIPVHFLTALDERQKAMAMGALGYFTKPISPEQLQSILSLVEAAISQQARNLLLVEDDPAEAKSLCALLEDRHIFIHQAHSGAEAIRLFGEHPFDCIVLDLGLADMSGFEVLEHLHHLDPQRRVPVIIHSGRDLTREEQTRLERYSESIILKGAKSPERLLNEVTLFLHVVESQMAPEQQRLIRASLDQDGVFLDKLVLVADDDMRNVFSLASILADKGMAVLEAESGREALAQLEAHPETALVLMDVMMPEMDGLEAIRAIRSHPRHARLPIIALTAKAMKGDREACLKAGASDYLAKPIDTERLLSLLRVWLCDQ
jgi:CheY-like chemotaxis protein/signal transduction histidine kinase/CHASE3 domain sensor protein